jgi:signal transduction histidine kinase
VRPEGQSLLTNLTTNAIRHTDPELAVRLRADELATAIFGSRSATAAAGIPEANLSRVFDAGWRGTPPRSGDDGGAGLGLAIARGVIESHGGEISVRNVEGGCRFEVALPVPQAASHLSVS